VMFQKLLLEGGPLECMGTCQAWEPTPRTVLGLAGLELTFPTTAHTVLCFALAARMVLILH